MLLDMWLHFKSLNDVHKDFLSSSKIPFLSTILIKIIQKKKTIVEAYKNAFPSSIMLSYSIIFELESSPEI